LDSEVDNEGVRIRREAARILGDQRRFGSKHLVARIGCDSSDGRLKSLVSVDFECLKVSWTEEGAEGSDGGRVERYRCGCAGC